MAQNAQGILFTNDRKTTEKQPDYTGNITLTKELLDAYMKEMSGKTELKVQIAGWRKPGRNSKPFISLSINAPFAGKKDKLDDDIPF